jgi:hypothetical protein
MCTYIKNLKQGGRLETKHNYCAEMDLKVWEVKLWKDTSRQGGKPQIAEARVTLLCNLPVPDEMKNAGGVGSLRNYSKL